MPDTPERDQQEATLQITLGNTLTMMNGFAAPEVADTFGRARELCRTLDDTLQLFRLLQTLFPYYLVRGELQTAHDLGERCLAMSQRQQDRVPLMWSHILFGTSLYYMGDVADALYHLEQGLSLYGPAQHQEHAYFLVTNPAVVGLSYMSLVLWSLGYPDQALKRSEEAVALAQELAHPFSLALSLNFATALRQFRREAAETQVYAETLIVLSKENRFPNWEAHGIILRGWARAQQGEVEEGMTQIQQGLTLYRAMGSDVGWPNRLILLAEVCGKNGQAIEGLQVLDEALVAAQDTGQQLSATVLYWLQGTLRMQAGDIVEAEVSFDQALTISRRQQAKIWELRATVGLSQLWLQQGRRTEVCRMLKEICAWFQEGESTIELREARALLSELQ